MPCRISAVGPHKRRELLTQLPAGFRPRRCSGLVSLRRTLPALFLLPFLAHAQDLPSAPAVPWQQPRSLHLPTPSRERTLAEDAPGIDAAHPLTLSALIDIAEHRNPNTRAAWDAARQAAAEKGIARSALFPTLTGLVLSQTTRNGVLLGNTFVRQTIALYEPALELDYTLFDFNGRLDALRAARLDLFASDFAFNNTHLAVMETVATGYFALLNNQGQVAAADINLQNAQAVAAAVDARLAQGLATLPDALQARAAAAQAHFQLISLQGAQSNAQAALSAALELPPATPLPVVPIDRLALPEILSETAADAIARALENRPDLLEGEARVAAAGERIRQARTAYYPRVTFSGNWGRIVRAYGQQDLLRPTYAAAGVWNVQANLNWTLFDGGRRASDVARALAAQAAAQARLDALRDRLEQQVWTAYTDTQTAFHQQQAAEQLLGAAQTSFDAANEAFGAGVQTVINLISAQQTLAQARSAEVSARANLFTQATTLLFRTGELLRSHKGPAVLPAPTNGQPPPALPGKPPDGGN